MTARPDKPLAEHTAEPWAYTHDATSGHYDVEVQDECIAQVLYAEDGPGGRAQFDAARIVACINACAGIADPAALRASHDALVKAATSLASDVQDLVDCAGNCGEYGAECPLQDMHKPDSTVDRLQALLTALATAKELSA